MNSVKLLLSCFLVLSYFSCVGHGIDTISNVMCIEKEREALLKFKEGIRVDHCGLLSFWGDNDDNNNCCQWRGIRCSYRTGHVIKLDLRGVDTYYLEEDRCLQGKVSSSIVDLKHLSYLDLSSNDFQSQPIPVFVGSLVNLKYLNLSNAGFSGEIPHQLENLSRLISLDLNNLSPSGNRSNIYVKNLWWLSHLKLLRNIDLSGIDLSSAIEWLKIVNDLPFLKVLQLQWCNLHSRVPWPLSYKNSTTTLSYLNLGSNDLNDTSIFQWLFSLSGIDTQLAHVDLSGNQLDGPLPNALENMHALSYLDLFDNQLDGPLPNALENMHALSYLDLSGNQLDGPLPNALGNMHALSYLDLSRNQLEGPLPKAFGNMHALSYLDLSDNQLEGPLPNALGNMHALSSLYLSYNQLQGPIPDTFSNLQSLQHLDLDSNNFQFLQIPKILGYLCSLQVLYLDKANITDELPNIIQTLTGCANKSLLVLSLSDNKIWGSIPDTIGTFSSLQRLILDNNRLNGTISPRLGQLSMLDTLVLSSNSLHGTLSSNHFSNLSRLQYLDLSNNAALVLDIEDDWVPPFQLDTILLSSCRLGPIFPNWLVSQKNYSWLDISAVGISDSFPKFFTLLPSKLTLLNMSHNMIHGTLPDFEKPITAALDFFGKVVIDMSFNNIEGAIPAFSTNLTSLYLNNNRFSDPVLLLCPKINVRLSNLDLSNNLLSGSLPDCWMNFDQLSLLHLENNNFSGGIPPSISYLKQLESLHLRNNSFSGELPRSLQDCTSLVYLDLAHNSFTGNILPNIGSYYNKLSVLSLGSNNFVGEIPLSLCQMPFLQILDLAANQITGTIPNCIQNLTAMQNATDLIPALLDIYVTVPGVTFFSQITDAAIIMWKETERSFGNFIGLVKLIDLSNNKLEGEIPTEISALHGLISLNLSRNSLVGSITPEIGQLTSLEVLDLSNNHLSGEIPTSITALNSLSNLDLSNNHFSGEIPKGTQLQGFDASAYAGNPQLCGAPLPYCSWDQPHHNPTNGDNITLQDDTDDDNMFFVGLYVSLVLGFIIGFWGVCGTLVLKRSWRHAFFQFFDDMKDRFHVIISLSIAKLKRRL